MACRGVNAEFAADVPVWYPLSGRGALGSGPLSPPRGWAGGAFGPRLCVVAAVLRPLAHRDRDARTRFAAAVRRTQYRVHRAAGRNCRAMHVSDTAAHATATRHLAAVVIAPALVVLRRRPLGSPPAAAPGESRKSGRPPESGIAPSHLGPQRSGSALRDVRSGATRLRRVTVVWMSSTGSEVHRMPTRRRSD